LALRISHFLKRFLKCKEILHYMKIFWLIRAWDSIPWVHSNSTYNMITNMRGIESKWPKTTLSDGQVVGISNRIHEVLVQLPRVTLFAWRGGLFLHLFLIGKKPWCISPVKLFQFVMDDVLFLFLLRPLKAICLKKCKKNQMKCPNYQCKVEKYYLQLITNEMTKMNCKMIFY